MERTTITKLLQIGLCFMTPTLFARFLGDTPSISFKMRKKRRGHKKMPRGLETNTRLINSILYILPAQ